MPVVGAVEVRFLELSVYTANEAEREGTLTVLTVDEPRFKAVVAPPAKLTVVAVVLTRGNVVWLVVIPPAALTARVPFEVKPEVAVISPEIVGVAVQAVPVTVKFPPKEVR
jgi:hypothetical protein